MKVTMVLATLLLASPALAKPPGDQEILDRYEMGNLGWIRVCRYTFWLGGCISPYWACPQAHYFKRKCAPIPARIRQRWGN